MSEMIQFVANYDDLSTDRGYQFRFRCDKCSNGARMSVGTKSCPECGGKA